METQNTDLKQIITDIENSNHNSIERKNNKTTFVLWQDPLLISDLSGNIGSLFVRAFLRELNVNEHGLLRWRLENKFRQYQILNYYVPNCMAESISFLQLLNESNGVEKIKDLCKHGYFLKSTLGHRTGIDNTFDRTNELDDIIFSHQANTTNLDKWMIQKKLDFTDEFRIHSFGSEIIYGITFIMKGLWPSFGCIAEKFVRMILEKLPDWILEGTLIGWDIGVTSDFELFVIEANVTGFHEEFHRGFQTSGYFGDPKYGSIICAWLNKYFEDRYNLSIGFIENALFNSDPFYKEFMFYKTVLKNEYRDILRNKIKGISYSPVLYLDAQDSLLWIKLLKYLIAIDFGNKYYIIIDANALSMINNKISKNKDVKILTKQSLLGSDESCITNRLDHEMQKRVYCQCLTQSIEGEQFIIL